MKGQFTALNHIYSKTEKILFGLIFISFGVIMLLFSIDLVAHYEDLLTRIKYVSPGITFIILGAVLLYFRNYDIFKHKIKDKP